MAVKTFQLTGKSSIVDAAVYSITLGTRYKPLLTAGAIA